MERVDGLPRERPGAAPASADRGSLAPLNLPEGWMGLAGRLPELTACREALSGDRDHAVAAIIAGPPGIGKTSLWRAVAECEPGDAVVLRTTGIPGAGAGLANIADLLDPVLDAVLPTMPAPLGTSQIRI